MAKNIITIPMIIKVSTNRIYGGCHWTQRMDFKNAISLVVHKHKDLFYKPNKYPIDLEMTFEFKGRVLDSSNCSYMAKMVEDSMVKKINVLEGDSIKYVKSVKYTAIRGTVDRIHITY
jgi:hypothetical protein